MKSINNTSETGSVSSNNQSDLYVVIRDGSRVSANDYLDSKDPQAILELNFWKGVSKKHSWGEPVKIVKYDHRLHRVWQYSSENID